MTGWFGKSWGSPVCEEERQVNTPVGKRCIWCKEAIAAGDQGITVAVVSEDDEQGALHLDCQIRMIVGGINHQKGLCTCCGGIENPDPSGMTVRQAAVQASFYHAGLPVPAD